MQNHNVLRYLDEVDTLDEDDAELDVDTLKKIRILSVGKANKGLCS